MKRLLILILVASVLAVFTSDVDARRYRRQRSSATDSHLTYTPTKYSTEKRYYGGTMSLQDIAMMRARYMAHHDSLDHGIDRWTKAPPFPSSVGEGIGCSSGLPHYTQCQTCIVGSKVVADGHAVSASGTTYRVRFFQ